MSGRPRLVEEGEPIAFANHNHDDGDDQKEDVLYNVAPAKHEISRRHISSTKSPVPAIRAMGSLSSLQVAAARATMSPSKRKSATASKIQTFFVVEGSVDHSFTTSRATSKNTSMESNPQVIGGLDSSNLPSLTSMTNDSEKYNAASHCCLSETKTSVSFEDPRCYQRHFQSNPNPQQDLMHSSDEIYHTRHHQHGMNDQDMESIEEESCQSMEEDRLHYNQTHAQSHHQHFHLPYKSPTDTLISSSPPLIVSTPNTAGKTTQSQTFYVVGGSSEPSLSHSSTTTSVDDRPVDRMEGVQDLGTKMPLVVLDGANVAHHYAQAMEGLTDTSLSTAKLGKPEPDARGIQVAADHFTQAGIRVLVVLPQYWLKAKPRVGHNHGRDNALMETPQLEILQDLKKKGFIVASPPTDDDDAYALTISKREEMRSLSERRGEGPGFVVSNDLFRDAQVRDVSGTLKHWLKHGRDDTVGPGRISYTFGDMGTMNDRGEHILDFIPNPRHPLVAWMERSQLTSHQPLYQSDVKIQHNCIA